MDKKKQIQDRINLLIRYSLEKTLSENKKSIFSEQAGGVWGTTPLGNPNYPYSSALEKIAADEKAAKQEKEDAEKEYLKNLAEYQASCNAGKGSRHAVLPPPGSIQIDGYDGLPPGICAYKTPSIGYDGFAGESYSYVLLKQEYEVSIIDNPYVWETALQGQIETIKKLYANDPGSCEEALRRLQNRVPLGVLRDFYVLSPGKTTEDETEVQVGNYIGTFSTKSCSKTVVLPTVIVGDRFPQKVEQSEQPDLLFPAASYCFKGYFLNGNTNYPFENLKFVDPRTSWDRIVDDYGAAAQWIMGGVFFIAGFFTEGGTWWLWAEIAAEGALGAVVAQREWEKGNNISAISSILFGLTPWMKTTKLYGKIPVQQADEMIESMKSAGLTAESTSTDVIRWWRNASPTAKETFKIAMRSQNEFSEAMIKQRWAGGYEKFMQYLKAHPRAIDNISWYMKSNYAELLMNGFLEGLDILVNATLGRKLNNSEKEALTKIHADLEGMDRNVAVQFRDFLSNEPKLATQIATSDLSQKLDAVKASRAAENVKKQLARGITQDTIQKLQPPNIDFIENYPEDGRSEEEIRKLNYKPSKEIAEEEYPYIYGDNIRKGNSMWYRIRKPQQDSLKKN